VNVSQAVARVYAQALMDLGEKEGNLSRIVDDLHAVRELYDHNREFYEFFVTPRLDRPEKKRILDEAVKGKLDRSVLGLLHVLVDKRREMIIDNVVAEFDRFRDLREGRLHVHVTAARPLEDEARKDIARRLQKATGKQVKIHERVDPRVLGGLVVKVGDRVLDGSLRRKLQALRRVLVDRED